MKGVDGDSLIVKWKHVIDQFDDKCQSHLKSDGLGGFFE